MEVREPPATYAEYCRLPEDAPRYEIIGGTGTLTPAPDSRHQIVVENIHYHLSKYVRKNSLGRILTGPYDVILSENDVVQPDILFLSSARLALIKARGLFGAPDLAVEVLSSSTLKWDLGSKLKLYATHGVREYWTVDPVNKTVDVWTSNKTPLDWRDVITNEGMVESQVLQGLRLPLSEIFVGMDEISAD